MWIHRVVVGTDFSEPSIHAVEWVARVFAPEAQVVLTHVLDIPHPPGPLHALAPPDDVLEENARQGAEARLRALARTAGIPLSWPTVSRGDPAACLAAVVDEYRADLVAVGAHRDRGGFRNWLGSTAERLLGMVHVPVLVAIRPAQQAPRHVLAAVDESPIAASVRGWASELATRFSAEQTMMTVVDAPTPAAAAPPPGAVVASHERVPDGGGRDGWIADAFGEPDAPTPEVAFGEPAREILAAAQRFNSGIIVLGRSGAGRARRALFGSVTRAVLRDAGCPVLVIPPPATR